MKNIKTFFKDIYVHYFAKPLLPSTRVRSGLPMVVISKKLLEKPKSFFERLVQNIKNFFK